ncbi:MAG: 16S rRNA (cytidine(1402)-2'-O)-methyltransferase [Candidatus Shapirobacteria bacterium]|nr:16S rRNA (cytidine(1402)-2'-O)-methyltransferase [Candidatus Shapirobacteria bacterium]
MEKGKLFLVATPIGNLGDITFRAVQVLSEVDLILAEDTRKTGRLLKEVLSSKKTTPPLLSFFESNEERRQPEVLVKLLSGDSIALVTNAGMPAIADPGFRLVRACFEAGIEVISVPGPNAAIAALSVSGLPTDKFLFLGFLPKKKGKVEKMFQAFVDIVNSPLSPTLVFYESPYRLVKTLRLANNIFGDQGQITVCRELTKIYEEKITGTLGEVLLKLEGKRIKGEITVVLSLKK